MKTLRRILIYLSITIFVLVIALVASVYLFKDRIIRQFVAQANKQLNTPVKVGKIDISVFDAFPHLSIMLADVYIEDSHPGIYPLLTAKKISFRLNAIEVYNGNYTIQGLQIHDSETTLKINDAGVNNYTVLKPSDGPSTGAVSFELHGVELYNSKVHYLDIRARQDMIFTSTDLTASIESSNNIYNIAAKGQVTTDKLEIDGTGYLEKKSFKAKSDLVYDDVKKHLTIKPSTLELRQATFSVNGTYGWKEKNLLDLHTTGTNTDIQTLLSLLPEKASQKFQKYKSEGDVYFNAHLKGEIGKRKFPSLSVNFGFTDATIYHPDYHSKIEDATLTGSFASSEFSDPRKASIILKDVKGKLNNEDFEANFILHDFVDPEVICDFKGRVDAAALADFYPVENIKEVTGTLLADISFEGKVALLKNKATAQRVSTLGSIDLQHIHFVYGKQSVPVENINGILQFNNNDLALSNVSGSLGNSDFVLNGFFKNIITFLLFEDQPIGIETDLRSNHVDVDQLFDIAFGNEEESGQQYTFSISRNIYLNFNCNIADLHYKKFKAAKVVGDLLVKNEVAVSRNLSFQSMGGSIGLSGIVDAKNHKAIDVVSTVRLNNVNVDSAFYVFENFQQDFIKDRHLKGKATAEVNMEMTLNQHLKLFPETLISDIDISIKNGELNNFEPMQNLNKYLDDEGLNRLRFADLKNEIHIENKTVYIPQMEIRSNVTNLKVSGTHTFDQRIDYRVVTPFRRKRVDPDAEGAIEETSEGAKLFLKITGTTDEYRVAYDTEAVRKKIASDLRKEVKELRDAFRSKGKSKQKEVELQEDEYFDDWE